MELSGRRLVGLLMAVALILLPGTAQAGSTDVTFFGEGSGHGVGLSQYGAKAMALGGATYPEILQRYYKGVNIVPISVLTGATFLAREESPIWVGLLQDQQSVSFKVEAGSADLCFDLGGECVAQASNQETWVLGQVASGGCGFSRKRADGSLEQIGPSRGCDASVRPRSDITTFRIPRKARSYRNGTLRMRAPGNDGSLHLVLQTDLESYVRGVSEVPEAWPVEAIKSQVVATRSLAAWTVLDRGPEEQFLEERRFDCHCNLRDDSSDQVFRGYTGEFDHPNWVAAVQATQSQVIGTTDLGVAYGLYFHSSAGMTESYTDVFGGPGYPYLVSANDSPAVSNFADNPLRWWGISSKQGSLATLFGFSWVNNAAVEARNESGSVKSVRVSGIRSGWPAQEIVEGATFRRKLGLPSTNFEIFVSSQFADVLPTDMFSGEILGLSFLGVTDGCTSTSFCPGSDISRGEMAAFLVRALKLEPGPSDANPFHDDDNSYFEREINTLQFHGITKGCTGISFCPTRPVTRAEMAAFLVRAFNLPSSEADPFNDDDGSFFEGQVAALEASGVTNGCALGRFCPDLAVSREEMAAFLVRALATR